MPKQLPALFLKEIYEKDQKFLTVYDTYKRNYNRKAVTAKFYSKYDCQTAEEYPQLVEEIKQVVDRGPREKLKWPETTNQWYGWYIDSFVELDRNDYRLYWPLKNSEIVKHGIKLLQTRSRVKK